MTWILLPEWTPGMIALHAGLAAFALAIGPMVRFGAIKMRYSKFRTGSGISGRLGMFILYAVPLLVLVAASSSYLRAPTLLQALLFGAVALHFVKRCLEVLFVHKYSGPIDVWTVAQVTFNYALLTGLAGWFHARTLTAIDALFVLGAVLFVVGQLINLAHHVLLARLRASNEGYFIPSGGLFRYVSSPHYLGEIVAWIGVVLMSRHLIMLIGCVTMAHYLFDRAGATHRWYRERFPDYPTARRALVPGVY